MVTGMSRTILKDPTSQTMIGRAIALLTSKIDYRARKTLESWSTAKTTGITISILVRFTHFLFSVYIFTNAPFSSLVKSYRLAAESSVL